MARQRSQAEYAAMIERVREVDSDRFFEFIEASGLDPAVDLAGGDFRNSDMGHSNLAGWDLSQCELDGCNFRRSQLFERERGDSMLGFGAFGGGAIKLMHYEQAILGRVLYDRNREPTRPALITPIANPSSASNWHEYCLYWHKRERRSNDHRLPTGAIFQDAPIAPEMIVVSPGRFIIGTGPAELGALARAGGPELQSILDHHVR